MPPPPPAAASNARTSARRIIRFADRSSGCSAPLDWRRASTSTAATACARWTSSSPITWPAPWRPIPRTCRSIRRIGSTRRVCDRRRRSRVDAVDRGRHPRRLRHDRERGRVFRQPVHVERGRFGVPGCHGRQLRRLQHDRADCARLRDPVLSDRYFRGPSGRGFITGNPDLEPESSLQFDLGLRYTAPRVRAATYFYHYRIDDLIERYSTQTDFFFFRNRGRAQLRGFEAEAQAELGWGLWMESAFQIARGRALDDNVYLDDVTPETFTIQLRKTSPRTMHSRKFAPASMPKTPVRARLSASSPATRSSTSAAESPSSRRSNSGSGPGIS